MRGTVISKSPRSLRQQAPSLALSWEKLLVGRSPASRALIKIIRQVAPRESPIVICGETGTGKEIVGRAIHAESCRAAGPFVAVDCAALSGDLFESQLFGHVKGSFTGALADSLGFFRAADGGTIFFDEIEELKPGLQAKLLRALQERQAVPLGATRPYPIDARVLCATNRGLERLVSEGSFRADLYFRLSVVKLYTPPLRHRKEDIMPLAEHFLRCQGILYSEPFKTLSEEVVKILTEYNWPGNVRELSNVIERAHIFSRCQKIMPGTLPPEVLTFDVIGSGEHEYPTMDEFIKRLLTRTLQASGGRKAGAARLLDIDYARLCRMMDKYGISAETSANH